MMPSTSRILVVDDEPDICANLQDILCDVGYDVRTATSGPDALRLAADDRFDLALLDLKMPGMDGLQVSRRLKELMPSIVTFMVTGYASRETDSAASAAGVRRVLTKPIDPAQLLPALHDALDESA